MSKLRQITIYGAGEMGLGISLAAAMSDFTVVLHERFAKKREEIESRLRGHYRRHQFFIGPDRRSSLSYEDVKGRIHIAKSMREGIDSDIVIESISESMDEKKRLYEEIDSLYKEDAQFFTTTSCIPISMIASWTKRPQSILGMHFMNPAYINPIVEVIRCEHTSEAVIDSGFQIIEQLGKHGILVNDSPGFVINRVLMPAINDAISLHEKNLASVQSIDELFMKCLGHKMGPLALADLIGLDVIKDSLLVLHEISADPRYQPSKLLEQKITEGKLGFKTGEGFYVYE